MRSREFHSSQEILYAKEISLRQQGEGKRPNKAQPLTPEEESALWEKGQFGDFNGKVSTNVNFKKTWLNNWDFVVAKNTGGSH